MGEDSRKKMNLLVVSNRLPISVKRTNEGKYEASASGGGLVSSLSGLSQTTHFRWFGWPGIAVPESEQTEVVKLLQEREAVPVFFDKQLSDDHYNGFSSENCSL